MIHVPHYDFVEEPMTDEDLAIFRAVASRIGGSYYAIDLSLTEQTARRDFWKMKHSLDTGKGTYSARRDYAGRLVPPARVLADTVSQYSA